MRRSLLALLICLVMAACIAPVGPMLPNAVSFPDELPGGAHLTLKATLYRPSGPGPFPAVVVMHHCNGVDAELLRWANHLASLGYVAIVPDSFTPRGVASVCATGAVSSTARAPDAYAAAAYLRTLPGVRGDRIGLIGFSHGAGTVVALAAEPTPQSQPFAAAVAYYPPCRGIDTGSVNAPTLILIGDHDDWTPAAACLRWAARVNNPGRLNVVVYHGATHRFDYAGARDAFGHAMRYDPEAAADAQAQAEAFLAHWLKE